MKRNVLVTGLLIVLAAGLILSACTGVVAPPPAKTPTTRPEASPAVSVGDTGWQARWEQTLAAAKREGKVTIYGELGPEAKSGITKALKEKFGIELESVVGSGAEVASKYIQETRIGIYLADVLFTGSPTFLNTVKPNVTLASVKPHLILPEVNDPKVWPEGGIPFLDKDQFVIQSTLGVNPYAIINTDLVKEGEITSLQDYLNPKWKGKIVMFDPTIAGATAAFFTLFLHQIYGQEEGRRYLEQLARQEPLIIRDKRLPVEWVARGRYPVHFGPNLQMTQEFIRAGAPIKATREKEGLYLNASSSCFAMVSKPAHPNSTIILVNWLLTAEGGAVLSKAWGNPAARRDVPTTGLDPISIPLPTDKVHLTTEELVLNTPKVQQLSREIFAALIK